MPIVASRAGHEAADLGHQRQQRHLADVGALAGHVRAGDQQDRPVVAAEQRVVGHERALRLDDVEHRMPAVDDPQHRLVDDLAAGSSSRCRASSASAASTSSWASAAAVACIRRRVGRHRVAQLEEQLVLQLLRLLVGRQDLLLVLLQLRRDVALGVLDRLLADVVGGDLLAVGVGDLDVVAEDLVEADLQARDAGPLGLLGLVAGDPLLAAVGQLAQRVELGAEAVADEAAVAARQRAVVGQRRVERRRAARGRDRARASSWFKQRALAGRSASP